MKTFPLSQRPPFRAFISYRRGDGGDAGRLNDSLRRRYGKDRVFIDTTEIKPGRDFDREILTELDVSPVVLVVIGSTWTKRVGELKLEGDWVRQEILAALNRQDVLVVPVLIDGNTMPKAEDLDDELRKLLPKNAIRLNHDHWDRDLKDLFAEIDAFANLRTDLPFTAATMALCVAVAMGIILTGLRGITPLFSPDDLVAWPITGVIAISAWLAGRYRLRALAARFQPVDIGRAIITALVLGVLGFSYWLLEPVRLEALDGSNPPVNACDSSYPAFIFPFASSPDQSPHTCGDTCKTAFGGRRQEVRLNTGYITGNPKLELEVTAEGGQVSAVRAGLNVEYEQTCAAPETLALKLPGIANLPQPDEAVLWFTVRATSAQSMRVIARLRANARIVAERSVWVEVPPDPRNPQPCVFKSCEPVQPAGDHK